MRGIGPKRSKPAAARMASRSTCAATKSAAAFKIASSSGSSSACTSPKCRSGKATLASLGKAPSTAMPACAIPSRSKRSWRGEATLFKITPASRKPARYCCNPSATAPAVCACPPASITSTTGQSKCSARSALAPWPQAPALATPSCSPIAPSAMTISAPSALDKSPATWPCPMAQESRLNDARPVAAR